MIQLNKTRSSIQSLIMQCQERLIARPLLPGSIRRNVRQFLNLPARKLNLQFLHLILCARLLLFFFVVCRGISTVNVLSRRGRKELNRNWERCHDRHNGFTLHISVYSCMRRKRMKQPAAVGLFNIFFYGPIWSNDIDICCGMSEIPSWPFLDQPLCELTLNVNSQRGWSKNGQEGISDMPQHISMSLLQILDVLVGRAVRWALIKVQHRMQRFYMHSYRTNIA